MPQESLPVPPAAAPVTVPPASRAFFRGLIDYAGLFPPARLPLDEAVTEFAAMRHTVDAWLLGRFIAPARRLADLDAYTDLFRHEAPFPVAVLGSGGDDAESFLAGLAGDLEAVSGFEQAHPGRVRADLLEVRLPSAVVDAGAGSIGHLLERAADLLDASPVRLERICLEIGFSGDWRRNIEAATATFRADSRLSAVLGLKIRCGGLTPDMFPTPEQIAFLITRARDARLPFKATAGLHHPLRHHDQELEVMRHGFLNVFGAGILAHALELTEQALRQVLRSEQPRSFVLDDDGFAFQDLRISTAQIEAARTHFALSFGSCSFAEPRDDLRALGLL
jgi:hypothetical protein